MEAPTRRAILSGTFALTMGAETKTSNDVATWTLESAAAALAQRKISSEELTSACLKRIAKHDRTLNAFITHTGESALAEAKRRDHERAGGHSAGPLHGIPLALKDNIDTAGVLTTGASRVFKDRVPAEDAEVARRLKAAGAIQLGKLNLDEFAFEGTGTTSCFGPIHNPWDLDRITGGSSAGSAAAVAARLCFASVGSDDGGSVRIPAAYCGVVGLKTTYGRVSTRGVLPSAYSLDTIGPITRTVRDAALLLSALAGFDPLDNISVNSPVPNYFRACSAPIKQYRIGIPRDYFYDVLHPDVERAIEQIIAQIRTQVKEVKEVRLPRFDFVPGGDYNVELYHYQKQFFDKTPELYHPWSRELLDKMKSVQAVAYVETLRRIRECRRQIRDVFRDVDALILPTIKEPAPLLAETVSRTHKRLSSNTSAFNRFGVPAITVPCALSNDGLPIGCQIAGPAWGEDRILPLAMAVERLSGGKVWGSPPQFHL